MCPMSSLNWGEFAQFGGHVTSLDKGRQLFQGGITPTVKLYWKILFPKDLLKFPGFGISGGGLCWAPSGGDFNSPLCVRCVPQSVYWGGRRPVAWVNTGGGGLGCGVLLLHGDFRRASW